MYVRCFEDVWRGLQMDPKFLRNQRYAKKHNRSGAAVEVEQTEE
jgi:hypothetical protein